MSASRSFPTGKPVQIALNGRMTAEWWTGKDLEDAVVAYFEVQSRSLCGGNEPNNKNPSQDRRCLTWDSNQAPPLYVSTALPLRQLARRVAWWLVNDESERDTEGKCHVIRWGTIKEFIWTKERHDNLRQDNRSPGRDLNLEPPKNEAQVLPTRPRCSRSCSTHGGDEKCLQVSSRKTGREQTTWVGALG
jgi:hypothetical protein